VLQTLIYKTLSQKRRKLYVAFIDFKAAFDSLVRDKLWEVLIQSNVNGNLLNVLKGMYKTVKARVRTSTGLTEQFESNIGLKQGCLASPKLFTFFINELITYQKNKGTRGIQLKPCDIEIFSLMFADDVALLADTVVGLQRQLNLLYDFCTDFYLTVNISKTKVVVFKNGGRLATNEKWY
jgi:hypothetical protein